MKKVLTLATSFFIMTNTLFSQIFYTETFDGATCVATSGCDQSLVGWTLTTGVEGPYANKFYVSCQENGNAAGICGSSCGSDQSLHVGNVAGSPGSFVCPAGDCGAAYDASGGCATDKRAESPTINCTGSYTIQISFNYMENGQGTIDDASLWYYDGTTWTNINALAKTSTACAPQGQWTAFTATLPASADNNPNVKIGFKWINNADNIGTDPSFAVDDITLNSTGGPPPVAAFTYTPSPTICINDVVTFTNTSTNGPITSANWGFLGGTPPTSTGLVTATTSWGAAGSYPVALVVTNAFGSDTAYDTIVVIACLPPPVASFTTPSTTICAGDCIDFTNTTTSSLPPFTSAWSFAGGTPATSTATNPNNICFNTPGTYTVQLIATDPNGSDTATLSITVTACAIAPTANFTATDTICSNSCLNFNDSSTGLPTSWFWTFPGGSPSTSTLQNPTTICYNTVGTYVVTLIATNAYGSNSYSETIVVENCSPPTVFFSASDNIICQGQCITITNSTTFADSYSWSIPGGNPSTSTAAEPVICYSDTTGSFTIALTATNAFGSNTFNFNLIVDTIPIIEAFPDNVGISLGDSLQLSVVANGVVTYAWVTTDTASIGDTTLSTVYVTPTSPTTTVYYIVATGGNGCSNTDSVIVEVNLTDVIGVPNAFSPNGDGFNDALKVLGPGISTMHFIVFNRYGQQVFTTDDQKKGWDGKQNGKDVDPGVFGWYLEYTLTNGLTGKQKGNVTVIK